MTEKRPEPADRLEREPAPLLIVVSGLSGAGKDAVLDSLRLKAPQAAFVTTVTSRPRRASETDGVHYHFVTRERFEAMRDAGELLEWAEVYGNYYGVPRSGARDFLASGRDTFIKVDVQGAATIRKLVPEAVLIFISPPSLAETATRLAKRQTEGTEELATRLQTARREMEYLDIFDYLVLNRSGEIERAAADILAIISAEKCRVKARRAVL